jgi:hypothetical protein
VAKLVVTSDDNKITGSWDLPMRVGWGYDLENILPEMLDAIENAMVRDERFGNKPYVAPEI